jgi:hypothetical protein
LTKKAPYKGLGADSEEKREPVSDIDTAVVDSLKALDPERPIREARAWVSGVCALWHFRLAGSCSLSVGGWAPSGAANPGRPVLADGWADSFFVFDVGAGLELWGRLGHDRIETAWLSLEARERAKEYAVISLLKERPKMNEEVLNTSLRKFLKTVGVTSQREIEKAIRTAVADGRLKGNETLSAQMVLTIGKVGLNHKIEGTVELD